MWVEELAITVLHKMCAGAQAIGSGEYLEMEVGKVVLELNL